MQLETCSCEPISNLTIQRRSDTASLRSADLCRHAVGQNVDGGIASSPAPSSDSNPCICCDDVNGQLLKPENKQKRSLYDHNFINARQRQVGGCFNGPPKINGQLAQPRIMKSTKKSFKMSSVIDGRKEKIRQSVKAVGLSRRCNGEIQLQAAQDRPVLQLRHRRKCRWQTLVTKVETWEQNKCCVNTTPAVWNKSDNQQHG